MLLRLFRNYLIMGNLYYIMLTHDISMVFFMKGENDMFCENCGSQMPDGSKFCMSCGAKAAGDEPANEKSAQEAAAADMPPVDYASPEVQESSSSQAGTPVIDDQPAQQPAAAQKPAYVQPAPPQVTPMPAQPMQPAGTVPKPEKTTPLGVFKFIGLMIVPCIPLLGFIMVLVWSFGSSFNRNTKNFARALLVLWIIGIILTIIGVVFLRATIIDIFDDLNSIMG
jgi:hypothetical protein